MYRGVGVERTAAGLRTAIDEIRDLRHRFWHQVRVPGGGRQLNQALEKAGRIADFMELAEVMAVDALDRQESCGAHFRSEYQDEGEARRDDDDWSFALGLGDPRPGRRGGPASRSPGTPSRCASSRCHWPRGATDETHSGGLAPGGP